MALLEIAIVIGLIVAGIKVIPPWLAQRHERRKLRDERRARLEAARDAKDVAGLLIVDRDLARDVRDELDRELRKPGS